MKGEVRLRDLEDECRRARQSHSNVGVRGRSLVVGAVDQHAPRRVGYSLVDSVDETFEKIPTRWSLVEVGSRVFEECH